ncbi:MAG: metallophosphoesterase family protein [Alphaproteobacteria bacterium]|nr:metallophosphoesterase family protein [Alphaproteobacteria bacterium]
MRLGLLSDVHATLPALDAVLAELDRMGVDRIVCLGDIVDLGPQPNEVVARLRERDIPCIRGNHDTLDEGPSLPMLAAVEDWTRERLAPEHASWLAALPERRWEALGDLRVLCVHGSPHGIAEGLLADTPSHRIEQWTDGLEWDVLVAGHTHVAFTRREGHRTLVNVGSAAQPFERALTIPPRVLPYCDFAVLEARPGGPDVRLCRIPQPMEEVRAAYRASGFPHCEQWLRTWD